MASSPKGDADTHSLLGLHLLSFLLLHLIYDDQANVSTVRTRSCHMVYGHQRPIDSCTYVLTFCEGIMDIQFVSARVS